MFHCSPQLKSYLRTNPTVVVGITGLPGSGKSTASKLLAERAKVDVVDVDKIIANAVEADSSRIFGAFGVSSRAELSRAVFASKDPHDIQIKSTRIDEIIAPRVNAAISNGIRASKGGCVIEYALLNMYGLDDVCDLVVCVEAPFAERAERVAKRGWSNEDLKLRESVFSKFVYGDLYIKNDGSLLSLEKATTALGLLLRRLRRV